MKNISVVIGANFGDEGKGLMTDYLCSQHPQDKKILNVRFNGGAQAAHTVVRPDGIRHVFSHFGAGSFNKNNITYLSSYYILNPMVFKKEYEALVAKGVTPKVYVHEDCIVTFPNDILINQFVEAHRGNSKHGSCGLGVYETVMRNKNFERITVSDIKNNISGVPMKIKEALDMYTPGRLIELQVELEEKEKGLLMNHNIYQNYMNSLVFMLSKVRLTDDAIISLFDDIVFEGAQGLLLDCANKEYFPHLTPSSTGLENVISLLRNIRDAKVEICYVTRSYFTRHGVGLFKTECASTDIRDGGLIDKTNQTNMYQGKFRYGYFDEKTICKAIKNDLKFLNRDATVKLAITHLDETGDMLVLYNNKKIDTNILSAKIGINLGYKSYGETQNDVLDCGIIRSIEN